jgi:hypothetical protein
MICYSCQEPFPKQGNSTPFTRTYYCPKCKEEMITWDEVKKDDYVFEVGRYRIYCDTGTQTSRIQRIYMDIESDTSIMYRWATILELPTIPSNLTEENAEQKLKMYLLFS